VSQLPVWVQYLQAFSTPIIALGVAFIAYRQWQTANAKLVLDLFEKRLAVFELAKESISIVTRDGHPNREADMKLLEAIGSAEFLFGSDVAKYLDDMWKRYCKSSFANTMLGNDEVAERSKFVELKSQMFTEITNFYKDAPKVFAPYMRMDQRVR
jgi:hypothetical protein